MLDCRLQAMEVSEEGWLLKGPLCAHTRAANVGAERGAEASLLHVLPTSQLPSADLAYLAICPLRMPGDGNNDMSKSAPPKELPRRLRSSLLTWTRQEAVRRNVASKIKGTQLEKPLQWQLNFPLAVIKLGMGSYDVPWHVASTHIRQCSIQAHGLGFRVCKSTG